MLMRAKVLSATVENHSDLRSEIETLTKKLGKVPKLELTIENYRSVGFVEITKTEPILIEKEIGSPLLLVEQGVDGKSETFALSLKPVGGGENEQPAQRQNHADLSSRKFKQLDWLGAQTPESMGPGLSNCRPAFSSSN